MWGLLKKYYFITVDDDWATMCNDLFNIVNNYSEDKKTKILAQDMSFAILDYLNRLAKERQLKL